MKKTLLLSILLLAFISCGGVKKTQEALNLGNYGNAIDNALRNLAENKTKKGHQPYVQLLEEAYKKNTERELQEIAFLRKDGNPSNYERIFNSYKNLKAIQQRIKPLLPLRLYDENRNAKFSFKNYDEEILAAKSQFSEFLYASASNALKTSSSKYEFRKAYEDFNHLNKITPGYKDTSQKIEEAYNKGLDYVQVVMINDSEQIVPAKLESDLLNFNTYGINDKWTVYHTSPVANTSYDYEMLLAFREINISPEQIREKETINEKQVIDGYRYAEDSQGNVLKDSLGNNIKIDKFKTVKCKFYQFTQFKKVQVVGNVSFVDLHSQQQLNSYPLVSEFIFDHVYANYDGDKRALASELIDLLTVRAVSFPTNEQMVYDAGEDLKLKLKGIISQHRFN